MKFRTEISIQNQDATAIDYHAKVFLLGSCFSENIGKKFQYYKFQTNINPFGILFHPKGIENLVEKAVNQYNYSEKDLIFFNHKWQSFEAHSSLSSSVKEELLKNLNEEINVTRYQLEHASHIIITLGTAWVYRHLESDSIVVNCHKIPQQQFHKELLSVNEVSKSLKRMTQLIRQKNPNATLIFTVSPVRHLKDGFVENMRSKSHLLSGVHQVVQNNSNVFYFPSYEIMMDDLRDYRFYANDLLHPNQTAVDYVWEKFTQTWCSETTRSFMQQMDSIQKGLRHRPFDANSKAHQQFLIKLKEQQKQLKEAFSHITF